jgi:hypothetical protein
LERRTVIRQPRRSVTRFFIPLIDVLILLFCIFLLMPYVKPVEGETGDVAAKLELPPEPKPGDVEELNREIDALRRERDRLLKDRSRVLERLAIRVLEIDPATGRLYDYDPDRVEIASAADAHALIGRQQRAVAGSEIYFLFLFPREVSGYPLERQVASYAEWFKDVPHGFDNPRGRR